MWPVRPFSSVRFQSGKQNPPKLVKKGIVNIIKNYKGVERNKRNLGDTETGRNWQQQEATTLYSGMNRRSSNLVWIQSQKLLKEMEILQELVWTGAGTMDEEGLVKAGSWRRCSPFQRKREDHSDFSSPALHHCTLNHLTYLEANWQGACVTYFQNTTPLGNECAQLHILALLIFPALALLLPLPSILCTHPKNLISVSSILYSLCVCISFFTPIQMGQKRGHTFAFSQVPGYPQQCFGS